MLLLHLLLLQLLLMLDSTLCHTTCNAVSIAQNTTVTCLFGEDISQHGFSVLFFKTTNSDGALVLACNRRPSGGLICDKGKGVVFDEDQRVMHQLTLTRPSSDSTLGEEYLCQMVPGGGERVRRCNVIKSNILPASSTPKPHLAADNDVNDIRVIVTIVLTIFIIIIVSAIVFCGILYFQPQRIKKRCTKYAKRLWSGSGRVLALEEGKREKIPEGWATYFYNLGWRDGQREEHDPNEDNKTDNRSSVDPHREKSYAGYRGSTRDPEGAASTQPLLGESRVKEGKTDPHRPKSCIEYRGPTRDPEGAAPTRPLLGEQRVQEGRTKGAVFGTSKNQGGDIFQDAKEEKIELKPLDASPSMKKREQGAHTETQKERKQREKAEKEKAEAEKKAREAAEKAEKKAREAAEKAEKKAREVAEEAEKIASEVAKKAEKIAREAEGIKKSGGTEKEIKAREAAVKQALEAAEEAERKAKGAAEEAERKAYEVEEIKKGKLQRKQRN